jgi:hypothetical protein
MPFGLSTLDLFEHVARVGYIAQLIVTPAAFVADQFVGPSAVSVPAVILCRFMGVFLIGVKGLILTIQLKAPHLKSYSQAMQATVWGLCGIVALSNWDAFSKPQVYINVALQAFFTTAYLISYMGTKSKAG